MAKLGLEQIDLFLIHWPLPTLYDGDYVSTWRTLTEFVERRPGPVDRRLELPARPPRPDRRRDRRGPGGQPDRGAPLLRQRGGPRGLARHGALVEAWSPIAQGAVLDDDVIGKIAAAHGRTPSQVTLRWHVQRGDIVFPKSMHRERMEENFAIFDFELTDDEIAAISAPRPGRVRPHRPQPRHLRLHPVRSRGEVAARPLDHRRDAHVAAGSRSRRP